MKDSKLVIAGIGGQGVIFVTKVLAQAGLLRGQPVMASENHGMSQRGGSVMSYVKLGGSEAPLIQRGTADALIALDKGEGIRNLAYVRRGGQVCANSSDGFDDRLAACLAELSIQVHTVDADGLARAAGMLASTNLVVLGFAAACGALDLTVEQLGEAIEALGPARSVPVNLKALEAGAGR